MNDFLLLFILATIGSVAGLIGSVVFFLGKDLRNFFCRYSVSFASGVLLTIAITGLLPEAYHEIGEQAFIITLAAFLISYIFEQTFFDIHHHEGEHVHRPSKAAIPLVIIGDTIHNFIDGLAIAAAYMSNAGLGFIVAISTFLHETPHEIGDFGILLSAGWSRKKAFITNLLSSLSTFLGVLFVSLFAFESSSVTGILLAASAGLFLYLGASDFLPKSTKDKDTNAKMITALIVGVLIMLFATNLIPHAHE